MKKDMSLTYTKLHWRRLGFRQSQICEGEHNLCGSDSYSRRRKAFEYKSCMCKRSRSENNRMYQHALLYSLRLLIKWIASRVWQGAEANTKPAPHLNPKWSAPSHIEQDEPKVFIKAKTWKVASQRNNQTTSNDLCGLKDMHWSHTTVVVYLWTT